MKHVFIVNPTAGKGNGVAYIPMIESYFAKNGGEYVIEQTEYVRHATELASKYTAEDDVIVYSVGGDGTAKEILDGINPGVTMCVVPGGTGNDFYKSVDKGIIKKEDVLVSLIEGENIMIDTGLMNCKERFMNITSFGLDADINVYACDYVKKELNIPGNLVYAYSAFKVGLHPQTFKTDIEIDGQHYTKDSVIAVVTNGAYYGGMFNPAPEASLTDGYFDICLVNGPVKTLRLIQLILKYSKGKHVGQPEVMILKGKKVSMKFDRKVNLQIDGENTSTTEATFEIIPQSLSLRVPKNRKVR